MRKSRLIIVVVLIVFLLAGCQAIGGKKWEDWTPQEKSTWFMQIYNDQYESYLNEVYRLSILENEAKGIAGITVGTRSKDEIEKLDSIKSELVAAKKILRVKKSVLSKIYPLLMQYASYVKNGRLDLAQLESDIMPLITELTAAI